MFPSTKEGLAVILNGQFPKPTGEELYQRFMKGDTSAFETLVSLYEPTLSLFINSIVHDHHEAKHLTIETFAKLAAGSGQFLKKSSLKTYLFAIGKNLAIKYSKMRGREAHLSFEESISALFDENQTPERVTEREESRRLIHESMKGLKDDYRVVLELLYFDDMSYIEAGRVMKKSAKQISDLAYRAKTSLKKKLEGEGLTDV